ncbi:MAG: hypothetical protein HQM13_15180 [SAR324 cluster bacterium]|nr:hypothetical protein [SAR324 cluster bacterium]
MKALVSKSIVSQEISSDMELRINRAVESFMKGVDEMLAEEHFTASQDFDSLELNNPSTAVLN